jgi:membrane protein required for colicin V production
VNWVDLAFIAVLFLFGLRGYFKGLFREILSLAGLIVGFMVAVRYDEPLAAFGSSYWNISPFVLKGAGFIIIFFFVCLLFNMAGWLIHRSERALFLRIVNRGGGIAFGLGKGAAIAALFCFLLSSGSWVPAPFKEKLDGSYLASPLSRLGEGLVRIGKERFLSSVHSIYGDASSRST